MLQHMIQSPHQTNFENTEILLENTVITYIVNGNTQKAVLAGILELLDVYTIDQAMSEDMFIPNVVGLPGGEAWATLIEIDWTDSEPTTAMPAEELPAKFAEMQMSFAAFGK